MQSLHGQRTVLSSLENDMKDANEQDMVSKEETMVA